MSWIFSYPKWWVTNFLYQFCAMTEGLIDIAFKVFAFLDTGTVGRIYKGFQLASWTVLAITIGVIGFKLVMGKKVKVKDTVFQGIILACLVVNMPAMMTAGLDFSQKLYGESKNLILSDDDLTGGEESLAFNIIRQNVADLDYLAYEGYDKLADPDSVKNNLSEDTYEFANFQQILTPKDVKKIQKSSKNEDVSHLANYLELNRDDKLEVSEIENGWFSAFDEGTFRYAGNHSIMNVSFIVLGLFFFMQFCKLVMIVIDLVQMKIYAPLVAMSDIETGQRAKQLFIDIASSIFTISALGISTVLFTSFYSFLVGLKLNILAFLLIGVLAAVGFIKGSDSVAKYLGINTSVKDGMIGLAGAVGGFKLGQAVTKGAKELPGKVSSGIGKAKDAAQNTYQKASETMIDSAAKAGEARGHISERGVAGFAKDKAKEKGQELKTKATDMKANATAPFKEAKEGYEDNVAKGISVGANTRASEVAKEKGQELAKQQRSQPTGTVNGQATRGKSSSVSTSTGNNVAIATSKPEDGNKRVNKFVPNIPADTATFADKKDSATASKNAQQSMEQAIAPVPTPPVKKPAEVTEKNDYSVTNKKPTPQVKQSSATQAVGSGVPSKQVTPTSPKQTTQVVTPKQANQATAKQKPITTQQPQITDREAPPEHQEASHKYVDYFDD